MKAFFSILLVLVLLGVAGAAGYLLLTRVQPTSAPPPAAPASRSAPALPPKVAKELEGSATDPVVLEALMYEIQKNPDTVAWLQVPGTDIDNSVVQSHNNSYYLRRDERKQDQVYGCYFADYECSLSDRANLTANTIIYGHSDLKDNPAGPKFSQLFRFVDAATAKANPVIHLSTPEETMDWEVFAVFYTDTSFDYIRANLTPEEQQQMVQKALSLSEHDYQMKPAPTDKLLTLSTCSVRDGNDGTHRFVVMARLAEK